MTGKKQLYITHNEATEKYEYVKHTTKGGCKLIVSGDPEEEVKEIVRT